MKKVLQQTIVAASLVLAAGGVFAADANVYFAPTNTFMDMPSDADARAEVLIQLSKHFDKLAAKLPAGQELKVVVLNVDLAGKNWHGSPGTREMRLVRAQGDWPYLKLQYTITENGKVLEAREEHLKNMGYMTRANIYFSGDSLRYEKQMLDDWFAHRIAAR
ncbi:MAG: DUF3016 domain-containing protein [Telluria sp.]